ncbi:MAG TPA: BON domain-containing protein [Vicinamibacteria bacterium]
MFRGLFYLAVLLALVWGAYSYYEHKELPLVGGSLDDAATLASVKTAFALHRVLAERPISVSTRQGVATLTGEVGSNTEMTEAEGIAASVPGVEQIENLLAVNPDLIAENGGSSDEPDEGEEGRSLGQRLDDVSLAAKVRTALLLHKDLKSLNISVNARDGVVTLDGAVETPEQAEAAQLRAEAVVGVDLVENRLHLDGKLDEMAERITAKLAANENLDGYRLSATANEGIIVLKGRVKTGAEQELAELLARQLAGSRDVVNEIER